MAASAKADGRTSAGEVPQYILSKWLPPPEERILEGTLERKFLTSKGVKWISRFAVLSDEHLLFAKQHVASISKCPDISQSEAHLVETWAHHATAREGLSAAKLQEMFEKFDFDRNGSLDLDEAKEALLQLNLITSEKEVATIFHLLDTDHSGALDVHEFMHLTRHVESCNTIVDFIPLNEIYAIEGECTRISALHPASAILLHSLFARLPLLVLPSFAALAPASTSTTTLSSFPCDIQLALALAPTLSS